MTRLSPSLMVSYAAFYDELVWTPALGATGGASGQTYTTQVGAATRLGRIVIAAFDLVLAAKGTLTGNLLVTGLPAAVTPASGGGGVLRYLNLQTNWSGVGVSITVGATTLAIAGNAGPSSSSNATPLTGGDVTNTTEFHGVVFYQV